MQGLVVGGLLLVFSSDRAGVPGCLSLAARSGEVKA